MQNIWKNCWVHLNSKQQQQQINTVNWSKLKHRKAAKSPLTHKTSVITASLIKTCFCLQLSEVKAKAILLNLHSVSCFLGRKCEEGGERKKERKEAARKEIRKKRNQAGSNRQRAGRQEVNTQSTTSPTVTTTFKLNIKICTHNPVQVHNVSSTCIHKHRALMVFMWPRWIQRKIPASNQSPRSSSKNFNVEEEIVWRSFSKSRSERSMSGPELKYSFLFKSTERQNKSKLHSLILWGKNPTASWKDASWGGQG